jgi:RimJ/RimL family protein N-acetyltransferase
MIELAPEDFHTVEAIFNPFTYSLSIRATIEGNNPGRIFVDQTQQPQTALALTVEGYLLAGQVNNPETNHSLRQLLLNRIFSGELSINGNWSMSLAIHPYTWETKLPELISTHEIEKIVRYQYLCQEPVFNWRESLPAGYQIRQYTMGLLDDPAITIPEPILEWWNFTETWGSIDRFLAHGISWCVIHEGLIVSQCASDCLAGDQIDLGIITLREYRNRNLASCAAAATLEACFDRGLKKVGWHCSADNTPSWKTAEKVGFRRNQVYNYYFYIFDPVDHLAELGWHYYKKAEYQKTVSYYERVFAQRQENPDYYYHLAALAWAQLGNKSKALLNLSLAAKAGWAQSQFTDEQPAFEILKDQPDWQLVMERINQNALGGEH